MSVEGKYLIEAMRLLGESQAIIDQMITNMYVHRRPYLGAELTGRIDRIKWKVRLLEKDMADQVRKLERGK